MLKCLGAIAKRKIVFGRLINVVENLIPYGTIFTEFIHIHGEHINKKSPFSYAKSNLIQLKVTIRNKKIGIFSAFIAHQSTRNISLNHVL